MRLLLLLLVAVFVAYIGGISAASDLKETKSVDSLDRNGISSKRFLRIEGSTSKYEEERDISVTSVLKIFVQGARAKGKRTIMLFRGFKPEKVLNKMKVTSLKDKNFNSFARYYANYLAKYPKKAANMPKTAADAIVLPKLAEGLDQKLVPAHMKLKLKEIGVEDTTKYMQQYMQEAESVVIVPKLNEWLSQKLLPTHLKQKLTEIGVTETKYAEMYTDVFDDVLVLPTMTKWLKERVLPPQAALNLESLGLADKKYVQLYVELWGKWQSILSARANAKGI
ncbi:hypothetical protein KRP22_014834 [Phytophthora ramorum]|uniref:uncharacterized protein n=1 Tax=Phytophthora ramorum TaxID=164328 RepID=UPI003098C9D2|nr:hypothetical protein KRP23_11810 [Phytophthora ramorum]KAH7496217.1 hypothetical protein KRP22_14111 [Phytophthora ramorum]